MNNIKYYKSYKGSNVTFSMVNNDYYVKFIRFDKDNVKVRRDNIPISEHYSFKEEQKRNPEWVDEEITKEEFFIYWL